MNMFFADFNVNTKVVDSATFFAYFGISIIRSVAGELIIQSATKPF